MAHVRDKIQSMAARRTNNDRSATRLFDLSRSKPLRLDRYGNAIAGAGSVLAQRLPAVDDARDTVVTTAQRALERARGGVSTALEQLPAALPNVPHRRRRRRVPPKLWVAVMIVAIAAGGFFLYRWLNGGQSSEYGIDRDWPAEPNFGPTNEPPEDDRTAEIDAEQSAAVHMSDALSPANPQG